MGFDLLSLLGAVAAVAANLWAVRHGSPDVRPVRAAVAALAAFYAAGYAWLIASGDRLAWSRFYSRVSFVTWAVVWAAPPLLGGRSWRKVEAKAASIVVDAKDGDQ